MTSYDSSPGRRSPAGREGRVDRRAKTSATASGSAARTRVLRREASLVDSRVALELGGLREDVEAGEESRDEADREDRRCVIRS